MRIIGDCRVNGNGIKAVIQMETIISSLISAGVALLICVIQNNKTKALIEYRLDELEKKVDKHNNLIERMYECEKNIDIHTEHLNTIDHRLDELERGA